jgi:HEPN domain-containing protein
MNGKLEIVKQWFEKGDHDFGTAKITYLHLPKYRDTIAFHCQQAVEKYLKSYLIFLDIPFTRTHSLNFLLSLIAQSQDITNVLYDNASELEGFAVEIRYPDTVVELSDEDIKKALSIVSYFREHLLRRMNLSIDFDEMPGI